MGPWTSVAESSLCQFDAFPVQTLNRARTSSAEAVPCRGSDQPGRLAAFTDSRDISRERLGIEER